MTTNFYALAKTAILADCVDCIPRVMRADGSFSPDRDDAHLVTRAEADRICERRNAAEMAGVNFFEPILILTGRDKITRLADELESWAGNYSFGITRKPTVDGEVLTCKIGKGMTRIFVWLIEARRGRLEPFYSAKRGRKESDTYERAAELGKALADLES